MNMTYDEAIARLEAITKQLEGTEAMPLETYKQLASEASVLLKLCRQELTTLAEDIKNAVNDI